MDDETRRALEDVRARVRRYEERNEAEWRTAARAREHWGAELDALIAEVTLVQVVLRDIERRLRKLEGPPMPTPSRDELLGDDLTKTIDQINAVVRRRVPESWSEDIDLLFKLFGDFWAHTLGRATALASGAVVKVVKPLDERIAMLEKAVGEPARDGDG